MSPQDIKQTKELLEQMSKEQLVSLLLWREQQIEDINAMLEAVGAGGVTSAAKSVGHESETLRWPADFDGAHHVGPSDTGSIKEAHARAAVEADRQARGEPVEAPTKTQIDEAMCKVSMPFFPDTTRDETDWIIQQFVKELWKIVASQPPQIPEGWQLVPKEPTSEMKTAAIGVEVYQESPPELEALTWEEVGAIYQAMLAAAPKPEK